MNINEVSEKTNSEPWKEKEREKGGISWKRSKRRQKRSGLCFLASC